MQFRLSTLLWMMVLFATSTALMGGWGMLSAAYWVMAWWIIVAHHWSSTVTVLLVEVGIVGSLMLCCLGLPTATEPQRFLALRFLAWIVSLLAFGVYIAMGHEAAQSPSPPPPLPDDSPEP